MFPPCSPHVLCYLCVCTCGRSGAARPFIGVLAFSRVKSSEFRQTKHKFPRFWKDVAGAKRVRPALAFTSNNADFWKSEKFRLKTERDPCQGMPWALKQAHNVWEIDVTRGAYMSSEHMRSSACLFFFFCRQGEKNLSEKCVKSCSSILTRIPRVFQDSGDSCYGTFEIFWESF